jgi:hypothetical protein
MGIEANPAAGPGHSKQICNDNVERQDFEA